LGDFLKDASEWLDGMRHAHMTTGVTYVRGSSSVELSATIGRTVFELRDDYGGIEKTEARDYIVRAEDLILDGSAVLPERGDEIRETDGAKTCVYEVMAPGKKPHWRWSDPYRKALRIHTKHTATEGE